MSQPCPFGERLIDARLAGALPAEGEQMLRRHLVGCAACAREVEATDALLRSLKEPLASEDERMLAGVSRGLLPALRARRARTLRTQRAALWGLAACLALVVSFGRAERLVAAHLKPASALSGEKATMGGLGLEAPGGEFEDDVLGTFGDEPMDDVMATGDEVYADAENG